MKGYSEFRGYRTRVAFDPETQSFVSVKDASPGQFEASAAGHQSEATSTPHLPYGRTCNSSTRPIDVP